MDCWSTAVCLYKITIIGIASPDDSKHTTYVLRINCVTTPLSIILEKT